MKTITYCDTCAREDVPGHDTTSARTGAPIELCSLCYQITAPDPDQIATIQALGIVLDEVRALRAVVERLAPAPHPGGDPP